MKTRRFTAILLALITLMSVFCSPSFFSFANEVEVVATRGIGISSGEDYFIMNYNQRLMAPNSSNPSDYISVVTWNPSVWNEPRLQWQVNKQSDGTFKLWSFGGSGTILRGYVDTLNIETECDENDESVKFEIQRIDYVIEEDGTYNYAYEGMYVIKCEQYYVAEGPNTVVVLKEEFNSSCCWTFMASEKRFAGLSSVFETGTPTNVNNGAFVEDFENYGYRAYTDLDYHTPEYFLDSLIGDDIFIYAGRASTASLNFYELDGSVHYVGKFTVDYETGGGSDDCYVSDLSANALCLSRCIIYLGNNTGADCLGGDGEYYNLVDATYDKGAHFVLGIRGNISATEKNEWIAAFLEGIELYKTINGALLYVEEWFDYAYNGEDLGFEIYSRGDGNQYLNF
jgi:hypothetical protein